MKIIQTEVPEQIYRKALNLVKDGWFRDEKKNKGQANNA
jgi:hypothetical protein